MENSTGELNHMCICAYIYRYLIHNGFLLYVMFNLYFCILNDLGLGLMFVVL